MALGVGCNAELHVLLIHHPFRKVRLPNNATLGVAIIMNLSTITLLHYHVWDKLRKPDAVRPVSISRRLTTSLTDIRSEGKLCQHRSIIYHTRPEILWWCCRCGLAPFTIE